MLGNLLADALNGFTLHDLPFLLVQLCVSAITALVIRRYWAKTSLTSEEAWLLRFLLPLQVAFTLLAVFSIRSPWVAIVFAAIMLVIVTSGSQLSLRSRVFFALCLTAAWGFGSGNLVVTAIVYALFIWPLVQIGTSGKQ